MKTDRLTNIDLIKFISIIIMVIDHIILISMKDSLSAGQIFFFTYVPLCQMGFLLSSGYLLAYKFDRKKIFKYLGRVAMFIIVFVAMTWLSKEELLSSGSILINFALSTLLGLFFLYRRRIKALLVFMGALFGLDIILQILLANNINVLNTWLADYPYPVNSYSLYFLLGIILFVYQDRLKILFQKKFMPWLVGLILVFYSSIFFSNIHINIHGSYQHLPWLLLTTAIVGIFFFFAWERIKLPRGLDWVVKKTAEALLYIYVLHYIVLFGWLADKDLSYFVLSLVVLLIAIVAIGLKFITKQIRYKFSNKL